MQSGMMLEVADQRNGIAARTSSKRRNTSVTLSSWDSRWLAAVVRHRINNIWRYEELKIPNPELVLISYLYRSISQRSFQAAVRGYEPQ
jgi:hypothetical protein